MIQKSVFFISILLVVGCTPEGVQKHKTSEKEGQKDGDTTGTDHSGVVDKTVPTVDLSKALPKAMELESGVTIKWSKRVQAQPVGPNSVIKINYTGKVKATEKVFDSNIKAGQPIPLFLGFDMVAEGWQEAMQHLAVGDKAVINVPADQAFGEKGDGLRIPPNADLVIETEVVEEIQPHMIKGVAVYHLNKERDKALQFKEGDSLSFHYIAYTPRGVYFTSYREKKPFAFRIGNEDVMEGLNYAFREIMEGEKAYVKIPARLAYGEKGFINLVKPDEPVMYFVNAVKRQ